MIGLAVRAKVATPKVQVYTEKKHCCVANVNCWPRGYQVELLLELIDYIAFGVILGTSGASHKRVSTLSWPCPCKLYESGRAFWTLRISCTKMR